MLLRCLDAHSNIKVVHNLRETDDADSQRLFLFLKNYKENKISRKHSLVKPFNLSVKDVLIIKQGVWEHPYPFQGIILARNPISIYSSMKSFVDLENQDTFKNNTINSEKYVRWLKEIDPTMVNGFVKLNSLDQFCSFYNRRMGELFKTGLPIVYYEELVLEPEATLKKIVREFKLKFEPALINSHEKYRVGEHGHGKIDLGQRISPSSIYKFQEEITKEEFKEIEEKTRNVYKKYNYRLSWDQIIINNCKC